jgi:hypothetical protein
MPIPNIDTICRVFRLKPPRRLLTITALRENPWNVISHELPSAADKILLSTARLAAAYCGDSEYILMRAARDGTYVPTWWDATDKTPDAHEESEELFHWADCKLREIDDLIGEALLAARSHEHGRSPRPFSLDC